MTTLLELARRVSARLHGDDGQTLVEYALLATLIAVASLLFLSAIGLDLAEQVDHVENFLGIGDANSSAPRVGADDASAAPGVR